MRSRWSNEYGKQQMSPPPHIDYHRVWYEGHSYRRAFFPSFRHLFRANFLIFRIFLFFFSSKYWIVNELDIFGSSGEFHE